jgi:hypothetical protein
MRCDTVLGIIDLDEFLKNESIPLDFDLFTAIIAQKSGYLPTLVPLKNVYSWDTTTNGDFINIRKKKGVPQKISRKIMITPEFIFNAALYDAEGGKKSNTLVSNSDERIVRNVLQWYSAFQPSFEGIREIRLFMSADEAKTIFDLNKIEKLIKEGKISSKSALNINQPYSILNELNVIKDPNKLNGMLQKYLTANKTLSTLTNKLRIKWDELHKKTVFEVYYSNTLNPLITSLTQSLLFNVPKVIRNGKKIEWIEWVKPQKMFLSMGHINLNIEKNKRELLSKYRRVEKVRDNCLKISRGREDVEIRSVIEVSPMLFFGLAHCITEKFSTGALWELVNYINFIVTFGDPKDLVKSVSIVLLAEEYSVLMKKMVKLFNEKGNIRDIDSRHKELERKLAVFLSSMMEKRISDSKISLHKIPYKEGIAVVMFYFPMLFNDLKKLSEQTENVSKAIREVINEKGLGRHAGKASFHMQFKGTLYPLINILAEKALTNFCEFFEKYVSS